LLAKAGFLMAITMIIIPESVQTETEPDAGIGTQKDSLA
jgi:hypothetical protein